MTTHEQNEEQQLDNVQIEITTSSRQLPFHREQASSVRPHHHLVRVKRDIPDVI